MGSEMCIRDRTLTGWHASLPPQGRGRGGPAQPPPPGQIGTPKPCVTTQAQSAPAGASHWEVVDGLLTACGAPAGYLTSDRSYKNFALSIEFKCGADTNSGVFVRSPQESGGYEVQIWRQQPAGYNTGAIVGTAKTAREYVQGRRLESLRDHREWRPSRRRAERRDDARHSRHELCRGAAAASVPAVSDRVSEHQDPASALTRIQSVGIRIRRNAD